MKRGGMVPAGIRLKVRGDRAAGLIRAFFATDDGELNEQVATLDMRLADADRRAYEEWVECLSRALQRFVTEATGIPVNGVRMIPERPHEKN